MAVIKKTLYRALLVSAKYSQSHKKNKLPYILGFGNVLPYGRRLGQARALPASGTRAACFDSTLAQTTRIHAF